MTTENGDDGDRTQHDQQQEVRTSDVVAVLGDNPRTVTAAAIVLAAAAIVLAAAAIVLAAATLLAAAAIVLAAATLWPPPPSPWPPPPTWPPPSLPTASPMRSRASSLQPVATIATANRIAVITATCGATIPSVLSAPRLLCTDRRYDHDAGTIRPYHEALGPRADRAAGTAR